MDNVISTYTLQEAIDDGVVVEVFKNRWEQLSGRKPIVATAHIMDTLSVAALQEIWNAYVSWWRMPRSKEDDIFVTQMNSQAVWVMEDEQAFTIMYPEDY